MEIPIGIPNWWPSSGVRSSPLVLINTDIKKMIFETFFSCQSFCLLRNTTAKCLGSSFFPGCRAMRKALHPYKNKVYKSYSRRAFPIFR